MSVGTRRVVDALAVAAAVSLSGCDEPPPAGGTLEASWTGADTGSFTAPATAEWCTAARTLALSAMRADTGVGVAIFADDSVSPERYGVTDPEQPTSPPRAAAAVRWIEKTRVVGFRSMAGSVSLDSAGERLAGSFAVNLRSLNGRDEIRVEGRFAGVPVAVADSGCESPAIERRATDSGVT